MIDMLLLGNWVKYFDRSVKWYSMNMKVHSAAKSIKFDWEGGGEF